MIFYMCLLWIVSYTPVRTVYLGSDVMYGVRCINIYHSAHPFICMWNENSVTLSTSWLGFLFLFAHEEKIISCISFCHRNSHSVSYASLGVILYLVLCMRTQHSIFFVSHTQKCSWYYNIWMYLPMCHKWCGVSLHPSSLYVCMFPKHC